ncbi:MAG TPA: cytochrome c biogenesis protein CcsA [Thermoanaerobaculia bacterium]|jgi:ABC-type uncharacterized transport system permease subunit
MTPAPTDILYFALAAYTLGTVVALGSLFTRDKRPQIAALVVMVAGFIAHTVWIGTICVRSGHPPITNLPETTSFVAWTVFVVELVLYVRYRVYAASFFVYPLVLLMLTISAVHGERIAPLDPGLRSGLFTIHLLFSTVGVAAMLIGLAFGVLAFWQDRALKSKQRGRLWDLIPSLQICKTVSYRALAIGFSIYTLGLLAGVLWSYKTNAGFVAPNVKEVGAVTAWVLFGVLLQSYISGAYRNRRTMVVAAGAFIAVVVAMLGIQG